MMRSIVLILGAAPLAGADFLTVITQLKTWLSTAETAKGGLSTKLQTATTTFGTASTDLKEDIAKFEEALDEAEEKAEAAAEAAAVAKEKKEKHEADRDNTKNMWETSDTGCKTSQKQLEDEITALEDPVKHLDLLLMELNGEAVKTPKLEHANLSQNAKATLTSTIGALHAKLNDDMTTKKRALGAAQLNCSMTNSELQSRIRDLNDNLIPAAKKELDNQNQNNRDATDDAVEARGDLAQAQKELTVKTTDFAADKRELEEGIKEEKGRIAALKQAIAILQDVDRNASFAQVASLLQTSAVTSPGFMSEKANPKPLLDLISKHAKHSQVRALLSAAALSSRQSVDAFKKVHAMINELIDRLTKQNMADEDSKTWCAKTENELSRVIADLGKAVQSATDEKGAADALVTSHKDTVSTCKTNIDSNRKRKVSTHEVDLAAIKTAKDDLIATEKELQGIKQAIVTIGEAPIADKFKNEVLNLVKELQADTEALLRTDKNVISTKEQELADHAADFDQKIAAAKTRLERTVMALESKQAESLGLEDKKRALQSELDTNIGERETIFEKENDSKCFNYDTTYTQRLVDRKAELAELGEAKDALTAYTKSIGIRFM